ncbi:SLATT domain-containing protein [Vibrio parahaemolyticus]
MTDIIINDLLKRTKTTKDACFNAGRRLAKISNLSLLSLSFIAISLIVLSLISLVFKDSKYVIDNNFKIQIIQITISIVALCISILVHKQDYSMKAEKYRNQGMDINHLRFIIKNYKECNDTYDNNVLLKLGEDYNNILNRYITHKDIDHKITSTTGIEWLYHKLSLIITYYSPWYLLVFLNIMLLIEVTTGVFD